MFYILLALGAFGFGFWVASLLSIAKMTDVEAELCHLNEIINEIYSRSPFNFGTE
mgnify:CR=1 FL=1